MKTGLREDLKKDLEESIVISKAYERVIRNMHDKYIGNEDIKAIVSKDVEIMQLFEEWQMIYLRIEKTI